MSVRDTGAASRFAVVSDLDGVLHRGKKAIPGAGRFVSRLKASGREYLFLTNSPDHSPAELRRKLLKLGLDIPTGRFYTSAQAMAAFVRDHSPHASVFLVGSRALHEELARAGARFTTRKPRFVIVTTGGAYGPDEIDAAIKLVLGGANFLTVSGEALSPTESGVKAGCGAFTAPIEKATGCKPFVVGKPNHLMIRHAERLFGIEPARALMIGDSLDTDIDVGVQAQMKTVLVLSGLTSREQLRRRPYQPDYVFDSVADIDLDRLP